MIEALKAKLGEEVEKLQFELNVTLPAEITKAVEHGDLRENSEYKAALERQQFVRARLGQLRQRLSKLSSIDMDQIPRDKAGLGSRVTVKDKATGKQETYLLVFGDAVELQDMHVTMASPIGQGPPPRSVRLTSIAICPVADAGTGIEKAFVAESPVTATAWSDVTPPDAMTRTDVSP